MHAAIRATLVHAGRLVADEQEQRQGDAPEGDELCVGTGHAVALAVYAARTLFFDESLEGKVEDFAGELTEEHEGDFDLAGEEDEGGVDDAEGLGEESEVGACEG